MVVDRQPGTGPEGPHGLGMLSGSQMSLKPRIGSNRVRAWIRVWVVNRLTRLFLGLMGRTLFGYWLCGPSLREVGNGSRFRRLWDLVAVKLGNGLVLMGLSKVLEIGSVGELLA
ncbi:hypothetical protein V6N11_050227 [Hibiscus sabdariffa]|uniref:Uncharacterized protein n=2 Tax=Hibiscus sabdariffa TaxID=183260 RepID=A0ABR1ZAV1_9ROSI